MTRQRNAAASNEWSVPHGSLDRDRSGRSEWGMEPFMYRSPRNRCLACRRRKEDSPPVQLIPALANSQEICWLLCVFGGRIRAPCPCPWLPHQQQRHESPEHRELAMGFVRYVTDWWSEWSTPSPTPYHHPTQSSILPYLWSFSAQLLHYMMETVIMRHSISHPPFPPRLSTL